MLLPILGAATSIAGNLINAGSQKKENARQRQFTMDMYQRQRNDALADWKAQNEYNDPAQMMMRLRNAGLNPNLAYGNPTTAGVASMPRQSSGSGYNSKAPQIETGGITDAIMMFYDIQKTQAQTDNIKAQTELAKIREEQVSTSIDKMIQDIIGVEKTNRQKDLDYYIKDRQEKQGYYDAQTQMQINQAEKSGYETISAKVKAEIQEQSKYLTLEQIAANLARTQQMTDESKQRVQNLIKQGKIQDFEVKLNELNMTKGDPLWIRAVVRFFEELFTF